MANQLYDDQKDKTSGKISDEELRRITGLSVGQTDQWEAAARDSKKERQGTGGAPSLDEQENKAASPVNPTGGKGLSATDLKGAESKIPGGDLWKDQDNNKESVFKKLKGISKRRKIFGMLGIGGVFGLFLAILTAAPIFRVPSLMEGIMKMVGEGVEEVIEHRAQRMVVNYLIDKAGGNPDRYVIRGSLVDSLWQTWHVTRLEDRIKYGSGFEIVRGSDGLMHLRYYEPHQRDERLKTVTGEPKDLGVVKNYDEVIAKLAGDAQAEKDFIKITRVITSVKERIFSSKIKKAFERRYLVRHSVPDRDPAKTDEQNKAEVRKQQLQVVIRQNVGVVEEALVHCGMENDCSYFADQDQPASTTRPAASASSSKNAQDFADNVTTSATETTEEVAVTGGSVTESLTKRISTRLLGSAAAGVLSAGAITAIDTLYVVNQTLNKIYENDALYKMPSTLASQASGAMFAQWMGFDHNIMAGRMPLLYIAMFNKQIQGAEQAAAYNFEYTGKPTGVTPDIRIDSNVQYPAQTLMSFYRTYLPQRHVTNAVLMLWTPYHTLIEKGGELVSVILGALTGSIFSFAMEAIFGPNWQTEFTEWTVGTLLAFLGANVDAMATGAKWFNQVFIGGQAAMNTYCAANLGCRALTPMVEGGIFDTPLLWSGGSMPVTEDDRRDMAVLPLTDRLFSLDEPNSLLNETFRAIPNTSNPAEWVASAVGQLSSAPGKLVSSLSGRSYAATPTLEQQANFGGVQMMGGTTDDFKRDIAAEVRQMPAASITCPRNNPQVEFNTCQADKEVAEGLMCENTDCPEYLGYERPNTAQGFWTNISQLWQDRQAMQALIW